MKKWFIVFLVIGLSQKLFAQETLYFNPIYVPYADTTLVFTPKEYTRNATKRFPMVIFYMSKEGTLNNGVIF
jgi:hypothetical protein